MDSFKEFYERLEMLKAAEQPEETVVTDEYGNKKIRYEEELTVDLSYSGVTPEYFEKVDNASSWLISFYNRHVAITSVHNALYDNTLLYKRRTYDDLKLCLMIDVIRCYQGLNHSTSLNSKEGLGLLILLIKMFKPSYILTYEGLPAIPESIINLDSLVPYVCACSDEINIPSDKSIISTLLQQVKPKEDKLYREIIYRFCEAISEADGEISISEREWLMCILHLDDDDISNDIKINSIFNR